MRKPSFICLCPYTIYPPTHGGAIFTWNKLRALLPFYDIHLVTPEFPEWHSDRCSVEPRLAEICTTYTCYRSAFWKTPKGVLRAARCEWLRFLGSEPLEVAMARGLELTRTLESLATRYHPDFVLFEHGYSVLLADSLRRRPQSVFGSLRWIAVEHNVESQIWQQAASEAHQPWFTRLYARRQYRRMQIAEKKFARQVDARLYISAADKAHFDALDCPGSASVVTPIAAALPQHKTDFTTSNRVIFFGNASYFPNREGLQWLVDEVWPLVLRSKPQARLVVAAQPGIELRERLGAVAGVEINSTAVGAQLDELIIGCDVFVSPIRLGSGIKIKNILALNLAMPMVATSPSLAGIEAGPGREVLRADRPQDFASAIVELLDSPQRRQSLSEAAFALYREKYTLEPARRTWLEALSAFSNGAATA